jgi:DNA-binding Lrp family transcriptional regulator
MKQRQSKAACQQLAANILTLLQQRPRTVFELAEELRFSQHAVRARLRRLLAEGQAHFVEEPPKHNLSVSHMWHIGPATAEQIEKAARAELERTEKPQAGVVAIPMQETVRAYPAINRRDPLVAALFGHRAERARS